MQAPRLRYTTPILAAMALGLSACGSTVPAATATSTSHQSQPSVVPPATSAPATATQDQPLRAAVQAYSDAYLGGDGATAFNLQSARCQQTIGLQQMTSLASAAKSIYGVLPLTSFMVDSNSVSTATVTYTYAVAKMDQSDQRWVLQGGSWKYDGC